MSITYRLNNQVPSLGAPVQNDSLFLSNSNALSGTAEQTTTLSSFVPALRGCKVKISIHTGGGTSPTVAAVRVQVSDGTTTERSFEYNPATAATLAANNTVVLTFEICSELQFTSLAVLTTLGGTSPTATMDVEVSGTN